MYILSFISTISDKEAYIFHFSFTEFLIPPILFRTYAYHGTFLAVLEENQLGAVHLLFPGLTTVISIEKHHAKASG